MPKKKGAELTPAQARALKAKNEFRRLQRELVTQMVTLATSGFGLVSALAWNSAIQGFVKEYIQKYFPNSAVWSQFIYAILITILAVLITYNLSRIAAHLSENKNK